MGKFRFLRDLEGEGNLALLLVHPLIGQPAEEDFVGGVVGVDGYADASGDGESWPLMLNGLCRAWEIRVALPSAMRSAG